MRTVWASHTGIPTSVFPHTDEQSNETHMGTVVYMCGWQGGEVCAPCIDGRGFTRSVFSPLCPRWKECSGTGPCGRPASAPSWPSMWPIQCSLSRYWGRRASTPCALTSPPGKTTGSSEDITTDCWRREYRSLRLFSSLHSYWKSQDQTMSN